MKMNKPRQPLSERINRRVSLTKELLLLAVILGMISSCQPEASLPDFQLDEDGVPVVYDVFEMEIQVEDNAPIVSKEKEDYLNCSVTIDGKGFLENYHGNDLLDPRGISIEVKSAAYIQTWHQDRLSTISFNCAPSLAWDPETNRQSDVKRRQAEVYVFAIAAARHTAETI